MTDGNQTGEIHQQGTDHVGAESVRDGLLRRYGKLAAGCLAVAAVIATVVAWLRPLDESTQETIEAPANHQSPAAEPTVVLPRQAADVPAEELRKELFQLGEQVLAQFPQIPEALHVVAGMYADLQRVTEAERIWQDCIRLSPKHVGPYVGLATAAMEQGKDEEAVAILRRGLSAGCASPELDHQLAAALTKLGRLDEAAEVLQRGLKAFPACAENWLQLGQIQIQLSKFAEAEASLRKAIDTGTDDGSVYFSLATACARQGKQDEAAKYREMFSQRKAAQESAGDTPFQVRYDAQLRKIAVASICRGAETDIRPGWPTARETTMKRLYRPWAGGWLVLSLLCSASPAAAPPACAIRLTDVMPQSNVTFRHFHGGQGQKYLTEFMVAGLALFIACGHFLENIREIDDTTDYRVPNILMMNVGDGTVLDVSSLCGDGLAVVDSSRGAGFDDLDNDGDIDAVIQNSNSRPTILRNESTPRQHWLGIGLRGVRSNRDGVGARVRVIAGDLVQVAEVHAGRGYQSHHGTQLHFGLGVTVGDYDNDGHPDLYLSHFGPNVLYRNNGDGTFSDVTRRAGVDRGTKVGAGTCFLDIEGDGDLDLYVANYVDFNYDNHVVRKIGPHQFYPGPNDYRGVPDNLFRNNGDGTFTDVSGPAGIAAVAGPGMGMVCLDYDEDGDMDVFVGNDAAANFLFQNDGRGHFTDVGLLAGVAYDGLGNANSSMGTDCGDFDNDGHLDLFMTDYSNEAPMLYRNLGQGLFEDATNAAGAGRSAFPHVNWGNGLVDFDNDGDRDLFIACGHLLDNIHVIDDRTAFKVRNILLMNTGNKRFVDVSKRCGDGLEPVESSRGAGFDDLDNDGDVDAVVLNANAPPTIIRNEATTGYSWVQIQLRGVQSNRDGVGARVRVAAGDLVQVAEVHSGRSYQSHFGSRLHFGLGKHRRADRIEVRWIGGGTDVVTDVAANRTLVLREGGHISAIPDGTAR